jgi:tetratricopeptide (TPR) repeat protein
MAVQPGTEKDILQQAHEAEMEKHFDEATELYQKVIRRHPLQAHAYDRLMIIYRKLKKYKKEMQVADKGIKAFEDYFKKQSEKLTTKHKQLTRLSKAIIKSTGLGESNHEYFPEPLAKWRKRRELVSKKLRAA